MLHDLGPIEVCCEAPPYSIVQACRRIGIQYPEDVRWSRINRLGWCQSQKKETLLAWLWRAFRGERKPLAMTCSCGQELPGLRLFIAWLDAGERVTYCIGQCPRCHAVFWDHGPL